MARAARGEPRHRVPIAAQAVTVGRRDELVRRFGQDIYDHVEANLHWDTFQFLGKLLPTVYVLAPAELERDRHEPRLALDGGHGEALRLVSGLAHRDRVEADRQVRELPDAARARLLGLQRAVQERHGDDCVRGTVLRPGCR